MDLLMTIEWMIAVCADHSLLCLISMISSLPRSEGVHTLNAQLNITNVSDFYEVCFTHADIGHDHIFVEPQTGNVTGIIDWEMAGFWPEWWEYQKALYVSPQHTRWLINLVRSILPPYQDLLELDDELEDY